MDETTMEAMAEGLILRGLSNHLSQTPGVVSRLDKDRLFYEGEADDIDRRTWNRVCRRLIDEGRILVYRAHDLPGTLPLTTYPLTGYATREHLLDLLATARPDQAEEIRDYLAFQGIPVPAASVPAVTEAQRKRIDNAVRKLNEVRAEVAEANSDARTTWYLDASTPSPSWWSQKISRTRIRGTSPTAPRSKRRGQATGECGETFPGLRTHEVQSKAGLGIRHETAG